MIVVAVWFPAGTILEDAAATESAMVEAIGLFPGETNNNEVIAKNEPGMSFMDNYTYQQPPG